MIDGRCRRLELHRSSCILLSMNCFFVVCWSFNSASQRAPFVSYVSECFRLLEVAALSAVSRGEEEFILFLWQLTIVFF
jgi:hypothetical protein